MSSRRTISRKYPDCGRILLPLCPDNGTIEVVRGKDTGRETSEMMASEIRIRRYNGTHYRVWCQHRRRGAVDIQRIAYGKGAKDEATTYAAQLQEIWGGEIVWG